MSKSGGTQYVDKTLTLSGALTQSGDIEIDVKAGEVLTYSRLKVSLGANTLTLKGGGTLGNTTPILLNNADSKLLLNSITVGWVSTGLANSGLDVDANSSVTSLTVATQLLFP